MVTGQIGIAKRADKHHFCGSRYTNDVPTKICKILNSSKLKNFGENVAVVTEKFSPNISVNTDSVSKGKIEKSCG